VPIDRVAALKNADALLQQGRLAQAIAEYAIVVAEHPKDWNTANLLGDLCVRAGDVDRAVALFVRSADRLQREGFDAKAGALYKKILKLRPDDEHALLRAGEISAVQGLVADARGYLTSVSDRRRARGDVRGTAEITVRLADLNAADVDARLAGARARVTLEDAAGAVRELKALASELSETEHETEAIAVLSEAIQLSPADDELKERLIALHIARGDVHAAAQLQAGLDGVGIGRLATAAANVRAGRIDEGLAIARRFMARNPEALRDVAAAGTALGAESADAGFCLAEVAIDAAAAARDWTAAATVLRMFLDSVPDHIPALMRLVDLCAEARLERDRHEAELRLADAYLRAGSAAEALFIAEDLVARDATNSANLETLRRALVLSGVPDPDAIVAQRAPNHSPLAHIDAGAFQLGSNAVDIHDIVAGAPDTPLSEAVPESAAKDLDTVFAELRAEAGTGSASDHGAESYRLGVTLFEEHRLDEALAPLTVAAREPRFRFEASALLGRIHKRCDRPADAVDWFERAAEAPAPTTEEGHQLLYEMGDLLESAGETGRALAIYMELQAEAAGFEDVPQRIARLKRVEGRG
jgi:tetratricopeptide (TPR) repeat protein